MIVIPHPTDEDMLQISTIVRINSLNKENHCEEITDGLKREESLNELCLDAMERDQAEESAESD